MRKNVSSAVIDRPVHLTGALKDYTVADILWVVSQFQVEGDLTVAPFPGRGNINLHTYEVTAGTQQYLLQKVNSDVFAMPHRVMSGMVASINAQSSAVKEKPELGWAPIELIPTIHGHDFLDLTDEHGWSVWRLMVRIPNSCTYKSLSELPSREAQLQLAREVGKGLAIYSDLTASMDLDASAGSLPGYRDTGLYYRQFHSVLARNRCLEEAATWLPEDEIVKASTQLHFCLALNDSEFEARLHDEELAPYVEMLKEKEPFAMGLWHAIETGKIRRTMIHGDTKIENFLFCSESGNVKSLVDLDTIMPFTWLADWGDMVRSMVNVAGEKETDLTKVVVDTEVYEAVSEGFLAAATQVTPNEVGMMVQAVQAISLELGLRFLTDYLRGDTYFQLGENDPSDLNKTRAMVQLTLYKRLVEFGPEAEKRLAYLR